MFCTAGALRLEPGVGGAVGKPVGFGVGIRVGAGYTVGCGVGYAVCGVGAIVGGGVGVVGAPHSSRDLAPRGMPRVDLAKQKRYQSP